MSLPEDDRLIELAERVAAAAGELGIHTALIGAMALAAHHYVRGTADIDLAVAMNPYTELRALERLLKSRGLRTQLNYPDDQDSLGGLLRGRGCCARCR